MHFRRGQRLGGCAACARSLLPACLPVSLSAWGSQARSSSHPSVAPPPCSTAWATRTRPSACRLSRQRASSRQESMGRLAREGMFTTVIERWLLGGLRCVPPTLPAPPVCPCPVTGLPTADVTLVPGSLRIWPRLHRSTNVLALLPRPCAPAGGGCYPAARVPQTDRMSARLQHPAIHPCRERPQAPRLRRGWPSRALSLAATLARPASLARCSPLAPAPSANAATSQ